MVIYTQEPDSFIFAENEHDFKVLDCSAGVDYLYVPFPTGDIHSQFALNMTLTAQFNSTDPGLTIYVLNATQLLNWDNSKSDSTLLKNAPDYSFSIQVQPSDYLIVIKSTDCTTREKLQVNTEIQVFFQNFNYSSIWPGLYLILAGVISANLTFILMSKKQFFKKVDLFFKRRFEVSTSIPGNKAYSNYAAETYEKFIKKLQAK